MKLKSIKKVGHEKTRCITVSNPNGLYVTNNGIVTHNSTCVVDINLYIATLFALMWAPYKYYGYSPSTQFTMVFGGYSQKKASELLLEPMMNVLRSSNFFQQCRTWNDMVKKQKEFEELGEVPNIYFTTSSPTSQPLDCKVYLPNGSYKFMKDIKVGDKIASPTNKEAEVKAIPYEGKTDCYEIVLEDSRHTRCGGWHKWKVSYRKDENNNKIWEVVDTNFMISHPEFEFEVFGMETKIKTIKYIGICEQKCININTDDGLYITDDHIITHNSAISFSNGLNVKVVSSEMDIVGQSQPLDCNILMADNTFKKLKDIKVGDEIASPSEGKQVVLDIFPQGKKKTYKITLADGRVTRCSPDHIWKIAWQKDKNGKYIWVEKPLQFIIDHPELDIELWDKDVADDLPCNY